MTPLARAKIMLASGEDDPAKLFGITAYDRRRTYRKLTSLLHPDRYESETAEDRAEAASLFVHVQALWQRLHDNEAGRFTLATKRHTYDVLRFPSQGDLASLFPASYATGSGLLLARLKMPRSPKNNDLMEREARALKEIHKLGSRRSVFVSTLVESFRFRDSSTHVDRRVNVLASLDGYVSLARLAEAFPEGLDIRDLVWIWRRVLVALSLVQEAGYVHGAIVPEHIMVHLERHEVVLVDWCYSTKIGETVPALVGRHRDLYAPEIIAKLPATPASDVFMLAKTMATLFNEHTPKQIHAYVKGCTQSIQRTRPGANPSDMPRLLHELTDLIERLYGKRKFRVLTLPEGL